MTVKPTCRSHEDIAALDEIVSVDDVSVLAQARLDPAVAAYFLGAAGEEHTMRDNRAAFDSFRLVPRISEGGRVSTATTILGREVSMPVGIAPTAKHGLACAAGEVATASAARQAKALYCASSTSSRSIDDIAASAGSPWWYQTYPENGTTRLDRAADLGYSALVLTVDVPVSGYRDREFRSQRSNPKHPLYLGAMAYNQPGFDLTSTMGRTRVTWPDLRRIIAESDVPVVVKGVLRASDAVQAIEAGAAAIWVSNHGGRQLDRAIATLFALVDVVEAVGKSTEVYVDGGFRRGVDVALGLALGARAVFVGRPVVMGLAVGGEHGAAVVLNQYRREFENAMYQLGVQTVEELDASCVRTIR